MTLSLTPTERAVAPTGAELVRTAADLLAATAGPLRALPRVVVKCAQSLDGRIATVTGDSKWISCDAERGLSHALRAACDAVLVGSGTAEADDPALTVRMVRAPSPLRVLLDGRLTVPATARLFDRSAPTVVFTSAGSAPDRRAALRALGVEVRVVPRGTGAPAGLDLSAVLAGLAERGVGSVLVEGGARVITSVLRQGLADTVLAAVCPVLLGSGPSAVGDLGVRRVAEAVHLHGVHVVQVGTDLVVAGRPSRPGQPERPVTSVHTGTTTHLEEGNRQCAPSM